MFTVSIYSRNTVQNPEPLRILECDKSPDYETIAKNDNRNARISFIEK